MKKDYNITHIAWLGNNNFGDVIMAKAVYNFLKEREMIRSYTVWCDKKPNLVPGVKWLYKNSILKKGMLSSCLEDICLSKTEVLIVGGGSVLHSSNSSDWKLKGIQRMKKKNIHSRAVGIGLSVGPFARSEDEQSCIKLLQNLDGCALRDEESYNFVSKIPALAYKPILAADLAGAYLSTNLIDCRLPIGDKIETIGFSVREGYKCDADSVLERYVSLVQECGKKYKKIKIFCYSGDEKEINLCKEILSRARIDNGEIIFYKNDEIYILNEMKMCDFIISTKLHSAIFSFLLNIPFISISYQKKNEDFLKYIKNNPKYLFQQANFEPKDVLSAIEPYMLAGQKEFIELSLKNFEVFSNL